MPESIGSEEKTLKLLKTTVTGMGVVLVVGIIVLVFSVAIKALSKDENKNNVVSRGLEKSSLQCVYNESNNKIFLNGRLVSTKIEDHIITIVSSREILVYDLCLGKNIARFDINNR